MRPLDVDRLARVGGIKKAPPPSKLPTRYWIDLILKISSLAALLWLLTLIAQWNGVSL